MSKYDRTRMSDEDLELLDRYKQDYRTAADEGDEAGKKAAHDGAEALRSRYGYSGGGDGGGYVQLGKNQYGGGFQYESAPSYVNRYQSQINDLTRQLLNREAFSYDPGQDPLYSSYKKQYTREGQRAAADTMGDYAAMTGGMPSTAAVAAGQQAGQYYAAQLADKIPELQQLAYSMYQDEGNDMYKRLSALQGLENDDYNRYLNTLSQYNSDRSFAYGAEQDAADREYNRQKYADSQAADRAETLAAYGDFSGYKALGYSDEEISRMKAAWDAAQRLSYSGGSSGGSSGSGSGSDGQQGIIQTMLSMGTEYDAYEYLVRQGLTNSQVENLWQMYQTAAKEQKNTGPDLSQRPRFSDMKRTLALLLAQGQDEKAIEENAKWWDTWDQKEQDELEKMLKNFGY